MNFEIILGPFQYHCWGFVQNHFFNFHYLDLIKYYLNLEINPSLAKNLLNQD